MDLAIVLLNWNAARDTLRCIHELEHWTQLQPAITVVDNASTDGSAELIARECPNVRLVRNEANLGFAGGNNCGIQAVLTAGEGPILLLNNDAVLAEIEAIKLLETLRSRPDIGLVGPLLFDARQPERLLAAGSKNPAKHHQSHNHTAPGRGRVQIVECIPGTAILIKAEVFVQVGLLDEAYFFGSEIADLCLQARRQGWLSVIDTTARAYHTLERSSRFRNSLYPYYIIRNRFLLVRKFHRSWKIFFYSFWTVYSLALWLKVRLNGQVSLARAIYLGLWDGLVGRFGNQNERVLGLSTEPRGGTIPV